MQVFRITVGNCFALSRVSWCAVLNGGRGLPGSQWLARLRCDGYVKVTYGSHDSAYEMGCEWGSPDSVDTDLGFIRVSVRAVMNRC